MYLIHVVCSYFKASEILFEICRWNRLHSNRKLSNEFSVIAIVTSFGTRWGQLCASSSTIYKFNSLVKFMCIVKAAASETEAKAEAAAKANRGEALAKCYEIKFTHKASLMTRQATRTARRQGQQQLPQQLRLRLANRTRSPVAKLLKRASSVARNCLITRQVNAAYSNR